MLPLLVSSFVSIEYHRYGEIAIRKLYKLHVFDSCKMQKNGKIAKNALTETGNLDIMNMFGIDTTQCARGLYPGRKAF